MMNDDEEAKPEETPSDFEAKTRAVFARARTIEPAVPPFLVTRVLARLRDRQLVFWKRVAFASSTAALAIAFGSWGFFGLVGPTNPQLIAPVADAVVVRLDLTRFKRLETLGSARQVRVDLPSGVHFFSGVHQDLIDAPSVVLALDPDQDQPYIPFAIQADRPGKKEVFVRLLDEKSRVIAERILNIEFQAKQEKT